MRWLWNRVWPRRHPAEMGRESGSQRVSPPWEHGGFPRRTVFVGGSRSARAYTLAEVVVAGGVGLLLTVEGLTALARGLACVATWQGQGDVQGRATTALAKLADELSEATPSGVHVDTSPPGLVFASPRSSSLTSNVAYDANGTLLWQRYVAYYVDPATGSLLRRESPLASPTTSMATLPPAMISAWFASQSGVPHTMASGVTTFACSGSNPLTLTMTLTVGATTTPQVIALNHRVYLRNVSP